MCEEEYHEEDIDYEKLKEHKKWCEDPSCSCRSI